MPVLVEVPLGDDLMLVEMDRKDISNSEGPVLATPDPGAAVAKLSESLGDSLGRLEPVLATLKERLKTSAPDLVTVEFGVKLGGETGIILAKGTAEVNFKVSVSWGRTGD